MKISAIDVGSNSVRLMVMADGKTLYKQLETTRLGEGLANSGVLKPEAIERTARAVQLFAAAAELNGAGTRSHQLLSWLQKQWSSFPSWLLFLKKLFNLQQLAVDPLS